jgi:photosynthetic reaction center cytochrome c subunit
MSDEVFKNIQVLKGIPVDEFIDTMGLISAALTINCIECHTPDSENGWEKWADDTPLKRTTRKMIQMVNTINKENFGGARAVTCFTCHNGNQHPKTRPSLAIQYGEPIEDPNDVEVRGTAPATPILDKYIQAIGGAARVAQLTSFTAKGTYRGFDTYHLKVPMDIYAQTPNKLATILHDFGAKKEDSFKVLDGQTGWIAAPNKPIPLITMTGGTLEGAKLDAMFFFPANIKQAFTTWRTGTARIDDKEVNVVQGTNPGKPPVKMYFDPQSGLLLRVVRSSETAIGPVPTQIDYSDYREVAGVKMPFKWTTTWTDNQAFNELTEIRPNVPIEATRFARPAK